MSTGLEIVPDKAANRLVAAFKACDLDCAAWDDSVLVELACVALDALPELEPAPEPEPEQGRGTDIKSTWPFLHDDDQQLRCLLIELGQGQLALADLEEQFQWVRNGVKKAEPKGGLRTVR